MPLFSACQLSLRAASCELQVESCKKSLSGGVCMQIASNCIFPVPGWPVRKYFMLHSVFGLGKWIMANYKRSRRGLDGVGLEAPDWRRQKRRPWPVGGGAGAQTTNQPGTSPSTMEIIPPGRQNAVDVVVVGHTSRVTSWVTIRLCPMPHAACLLYTFGHYCCRCGGPWASLSGVRVLRPALHLI